MSRRIISISLVIVLVAPVLVTYCWIQYQKSVVRHEVKQRVMAGMDKEELVLLKFTQEQSETLLRWEHAREFEYQHQMYDVVETQTRGDTIYYWCWWDYEETQLNRQLVELTTNALETDPQRKKNQERLIGFLETLYLSNAFEWTITVARNTHEQGIHYIASYLSISFKPPTPPPKV